MPQWTIKQVKEELPPVKVKIGRKPYTYAKLSGRMCDEATVTVFNQDKLHSGNSYYRDWKYSWEQIVRSLNSEKPLVLEE